jgi:HEAT repeat protein
MEPLEGRDFWEEDASQQFSALTERAGSDDPLERWAVTFALGDLDTVESRNLLRTLSGDDDAAVAHTAVATLKRLTRREQAPGGSSGRRMSSARLYAERVEARVSMDRVRLLPMLADPRDSVRAAAARALGELRDEKSAGRVADLLDDSSPTVRRAAAWSLGATATPGASEFLVDLLQDDDAGVRAVAASALGELCDIDCAEPLAAALSSDASAEVRLSACASLAQCGGVVEETGTQRERRFLLSECAIEALREAADGDSDAAVRGLAVDVILELDDLEETTGNGSATVFV